MTVAPERVRVQFRYRRGQQVWYAGRRYQHYTIVQQRYTRRDILCPIYEYLLTPANGLPDFWALEADLEPLTENDR